MIGTPGPWNDQHPLFYDLDDPLSPALPHAGNAVARLAANARLINGVKGNGMGPPIEAGDVAYLRRVRHYQAGHGG